jgi:3'(2'), 5'-bisphosphate nucleotidase
VQNVGATRQSGRDTAVRIHTTKTAPTPLRIVGSRSHRDSVLDRYLPQLEPYQLVAVGSSIKFCLVAEGSADFYPRFGPTSEWDTAAAQAVVEAAGGRVIQTDGQRLRYNAKAEVLNPHFLVSGDPTRDWRAELQLND